MKRAIAYLIAGAIAMLCFLYPHLMLNPGELSKGHQKLNNNCTACHKPFWGIETGKCTSCHSFDKLNSRASSDSVAKSKTLAFHRKIKNIACTACHSDHKGLIPQNSTGHFDHELLPAEIKSNCNDCHAKPVDKLHNEISASCSACHSTADWKFSGAFKHDLISETSKSNCLLCHAKPSDSFHQSVNDNCDKCHTTSQWAPSTFDHSAYFVLDNDHRVKCNICHSNNNLAVYTCYGCHEHTESAMLRKHNEEGIYNISDCARCHRSGDEHDIRGSGKSSNEKSNKEHDKESDEGDD